MKEDQDGAEPAAGSVAVANLLRLAAMARPEAAEKLRDRALDTLAAFRDRLDDVPVALTQMCCSAFLLSAGELDCHALQINRSWKHLISACCAVMNLSLAKAENLTEIPPSQDLCVLPTVVSQLPAGSSFVD